MAKRDLKSEQLEAALIDRLDRLNRRIERLKAEHVAVRAMLIANRRDNLRYKGAIRSNSLNRVMVQRRVLDVLRDAAPRPVPVTKLYEAVNVGQEELIPATTFRSHLHRMKQEGVIAAAGARGSYKLPKP